MYVHAAKQGRGVYYIYIRFVGILARYTWLFGFTAHQREFHTFGDGDVHPFLCNYETNVIIKKGKHSIQLYKDHIVVDNGKPAVYNYKGCKISEDISKESVLELSERNAEFATEPSGRSGTGS